MKKQNKELNCDTIEIVRDLKDWGDMVVFDSENRQIALNETPLLYWNLKKRPHHARTANSRDNWETPLYFFDILDKEFRFTLDPCASDDNHKCEKYFTEREDGLVKSWQNETVFCNPPYSNKDEWIEKAWSETEQNANTTVVLLIPDTTDTKAFHQYIFPYAREIRFTKGRIAFIDPITKCPVKGNPRGSAVVVFHRSVITVRNRYSEKCRLGTISTKNEHIICPLCKQITNDISDHEKYSCPYAGDE